MRTSLSAGDIVFLQPLGNNVIRSKPDYLMEAEITKVAKKYLYLRPVGSNLPADYARVEQDTLMYYDHNANRGWALWLSPEEYESHKAAQRALECMVDLCQSARSLFGQYETRFATQPVAEQIQAVCLEMTKLLTLIEAKANSSTANPEDLATAAQFAVHSYINGRTEPQGLRPACHLIHQIIKGENENV